MDMILHHIFANTIVFFSTNHYYLIDIAEQSVIIKNVLSLEISTIFLTMRNILSTIKIENIATIQKLNDICFVFTFAYFRVYRYTQTLIVSNTLTELILVISRNKFYQYSMFVSLYGLLVLNYYWFFLILRKMCKKVQ